MTVKYKKSSTERCYYCRKRLLTLTFLCECRSRDHVLLKTPVRLIVFSQDVCLEHECSYRHSILMMYAYEIFVTFNLDINTLVFSCVQRLLASCFSISRQFYAPGAVVIKSRFVSHCKSQFSKCHEVVEKTLS